MKKIIVNYNVPKCSQKQYDQSWEDLKSAGVENPRGILFHVGGPTPNGGWFVTEVWNSEEEFKDYSQILIPIMMQNNIVLTELPTIMPAHFIVQNVYQLIKSEVALS